MYECAKLKDIAIFFDNKSEKELVKFENMLKTVLSYYQLSYQKINRIKIKSLKNEKDCQRVAEENLNPEVSVCFWILWGRKKNGVNYDKIKRYLVNNIPVPS